MSTAADALEPRELGTLIVVVGKARNLPNKSRFGKQDPFCTVRLQEEKQRTKAIKRGGQHPEWDEELRFTVKEDLDDVIARSESSADTSLSASSSQPNVPGKDGSISGVTTAAALASKSRKGPIAKIGKKLNVAVYADDAKEPELIGECAVLIDDVLKKGEVDEWYEFTYKDKYSGEVYLELTFYSNEAPPVKRNPHIQRYGQASLAGVGSSVSLSSSSRPSMASLSTSSSVSGMNLYIPPYAQPPREPSPAPSAMPAVASPNSFAQLGLPPSRSHNRNQSVPSLPGQPGYPPSLSSMASISTLQPIPADPLDALTRPMSSMSISSSYSQRPLPTTTPALPQPQHQQQSAGPSHRHSLGEAPWSNLLPPSSQPPAPTPRPMSTSDTASLNQYQWDQIRQNAATPVARPGSAYPPQAGYTNGSYPDPRSPSPIPPTLTPGHPPVQKHHAHSFSGLSGQPHPSTYLNPAPTPPAPSLSAPPTNPYNTIPSSSFPSLDSYSAATPMNPYRASTPQPQPDYAGAQTPRPQEFGQGYTAPQQYQPPPSNAYPSHPSSQFHSSSSSNWSASDPTPPRRQSTPSGAQPNSSGYVPWYQQTQPSQPQQAQSYGHTPTPPPVPDYNRPAPNPPAPPRSSMGYYPSDELYALQRDQLTAQAPWQHQQQHHVQYQSHDPYRQASPAPPTSYPQQSYHQHQHLQPGYTDTPPRAPSGWQSTIPQSSYAPTPPPQQPYQSTSYPPQPPQREPSPAPPPRAPEGWYSQQTQQLGPAPSHAPPRTPSPGPAVAAPGIRHDWKSYMQSLNAAGRSASPQPPPLPNHRGQQEWYTPPPSLPSSIRPPDGWHSGMHVSQDGHHWRG